jgi:hypothetical protein
MTQDCEVTQALMMAHMRDQLRRARQAIVIASAIASAASLLAAWGWLR